MKLLRSMIPFVGLVAGLYILLLVLMFLFQDKLLFLPSDEIIYTPASAGLTASDIWVETDDGQKLHGWYFPNESAEFVVLLSHGNAGNISGRMSIAESLLRSGASVVMYDYRGYGQSSGKPSEKGFYTDIEAMLDHLESDLGYPSNRVILYGRSLGGAVSAYAATKAEVGGLVLDSAFLSVHEMIGDLYPFVPPVLARYTFSTLDYVKELREIPVMVMHSREDEIVGYRHGRTLFSTLEEPKVFVDLKGGHNDNFYLSRKQFEQAWHAYLNGL